MAWAVFINNFFGMCGIKIRKKFVTDLLLCSRRPELDVPSYEDGDDTHWCLYVQVTSPYGPSRILISIAVGFYAGLNLVAWFMIFCFVRETKQLTLEEIDRTFTATISPGPKYLHIANTPSQRSSRSLPSHSCTTKPPCGCRGSSSATSSSKRTSPSRRASSRRRSASTALQARSPRSIPRGAELFDKLVLEHVESFGGNNLACGGL